MSENEKTLVSEAKQRRSPRFPVLAIDEAIERARRIYRQDKLAFASLEAIKEHMGYTTKGKGGRAGRAAAALKQYGLLDERGGRFRISDLAFKILEMGEDSPERIALVKKAALNPPIIRKVFRQFEGEPPSDKTLRDYLLFDEGFTPDSARDFIRIIRQTKDIANPSPEDYTSGEESEGAESPPSGGSPMPQPPPTFTAQPKPEVRQAFTPAPASSYPQLPLGQELRFNISRDSQAIVVFTGSVTQEAVEKLAALLELQKDTFPTKAELEQPKERDEVDEAFGVE